MAIGTDNKRIAKNTVFLYLRMVFVLLVTLYTSRVILQVLGVDDYGLYIAVGGIVGFLSFINATLSTGTSRFITFELGTGDRGKLEKTFATTCLSQIFLALAVVLLTEFVGLWYIYHKMVIPAERFSVALLAFHLSNITAFFSLLLVPYQATIIAHERMSFFAYMSIVEVSLKLGVVYMLTIGNADRLVLYAVLLLVVQVVVVAFYFIFCWRFFDETRTKLRIDRPIFKEVVGFSGWSLFAGGSIALNNQGIILLLNLFFSSPVIVARTISIQVNSAANQLVSNFRTAVNPQIVKRLATGDLDGSKKLLLFSTEISYYLMLVLCLPVCLLAYPILKMWLGQVPVYSVVFLQLILVQSLFQVFDTSFYTALYAKGRLRENALISPTLGFLAFPIVFVLFRLGFSPVSLSWVFLIYYAVLGLVIKPLLIIKIAGYNCNEIFKVFKTCFWVTVIAVPVPIGLFYILNSDENLVHASIVLLTSLLSVILSVWLAGLPKAIKSACGKYITSKFI